MSDFARGSAGRDDLDGRRAPSPVTRIRKGPGVLAELAQRLDDLHSATGAPIMARRPWLETWIRCFTDHEPWAVTVERNGHLDGAALLARRRRSGLAEIVRLGHWATDHARLPARDGATAAALAEEIVGEARSIRGPWQLHLGQIPVADPVLNALRARLPGAVIEPGDGSPVLRFSSDRSPASYLSKNHRQNSRTALNRLRRDGIGLRVDTTGDPAAIDALFPEVDAVRRNRDARTGRVDKLVDRQYAAFRRAVVLEHAARGEAELTTIRFDGELAAYNLALLDGGAYRLWDSRMSPAFERYYPGRLVLDESIRRALEDRRFTEFDFLRGQVQYKLWIANDVVATETLVAWSTPLIRAAVHSLSRLRGRVRSSVNAVRRLI